MNLFNLKIAGILLGGFLLLCPGSGQALVSPEHYEKMQMEKNQKNKEPEKVKQRVPIENQVLRSGEIPTPLRPHGNRFDHIRQH
jgi:hypothetical protein